MKKEPNGCLICLGLCIVAGIIKGIFDINFIAALLYSFMGLFCVFAFSVVSVLVASEISETLNMFNKKNKSNKITAYIKNNRIMNTQLTTVLQQTDQMKACLQSVRPLDIEALQKIKAVLE
jgi:hypothetical protein